MNNTPTNQLFILLTDVCALDCEFCFYKDIRQTDKIEVDRGNAEASLTALINGADQIGLSGHGEPLLNMEGLLRILRLSSGKRFILTTSGSFRPERLQKIIADINAACHDSSSECLIRLSFDPYHAKAVRYDNFENLLRWFMNGNEWSNCSLFFRSNIPDEQFVAERFQTVCSENGWELKWEQKEQFTQTAIVENHRFDVVYRPIVNPGDIGVHNSYSIFEYMKIVSDLSGADLTLGYREDKSNKGLDITINPDGKAYFYGAELSSLGNIYDDRLTYDLLNKRLDDDSIYEVLRSRPLKEIFKILSQDPQFEQSIIETNYPYWVIRTLNEIDASKLRRLLTA